MISSKKALYATVNGFKIKKFTKPPIELSKDEQSLYSRYQYSAKTRGYEFNLSTDSFKRLIYSKCYFCGIGPKQTHKSIAYNGIDRLDNTKGYERTNCLACCKVCNRAKGTMGSDEFMEYTVRIMHFLTPAYNAYKDNNLSECESLLKNRLAESGVIRFEELK